MASCVPEHYEGEILDVRLGKKHQLSISVRIVTKRSSGSRGALLGSDGCICSQIP